MFSIHRGKLQGVLYRATLERLGPDRVQTGHRLVGWRELGDGIVARFERRSDGAIVEVAGDALIGADGIHSALRASFYPDEGPPAWNGLMLWRGALDWPIYADGRTVVIAGGLTAKLVYYPIYADSEQPDQRLMNWVVMVRLGDGSRPPARREDWGRPGRLDEALPFVRDQFQLDFVDPAALITATGTFYEFPCCDREPLPRWSFGRATLLGDAAHPMYPTGGNGAAQAVLDARALARHLASGQPIAEALAAYETERRPATTAIVLSSRRGGPERVIDLVEGRAPDGFTDLEAVAPYAEREAIVRGYASLAGYAREQVNRP
jgi:2-polyprenyl-6-methoxyphenol hydroxylase-like FAD-dependent oxidoreductase